MSWEPDVNGVQVDEVRQARGDAGDAVGAEKVLAAAVVGGGGPQA